jgi:spectinomycin phosphotransferase
VHERPGDLTDADIGGVLARQWRLAVAGLTYLPVGFGGYHWLAAGPDGTRWFVTAHGPWNASVADLAAALATAAGLPGAGLDFVVAPVPASDGQAVCQVSRYAVSVCPFLDAVPGRWGEQLTERDRDVLAGMLADLHRVAPPPAAPVRPLELPGRCALDVSLAERGRPWHGGPFSEPARNLLAGYADGLVRALARFDALCCVVSADGRSRAYTHGEPHPGNLLRAGRRLLLVDWETAGLAPPERDLWWVLASATGAAAQRYAARSGLHVSAAALDLYRLRWGLDDISLYLAEFRRPHARTADTEVSIAGLRDALERLEAPDSQR